MKILIFFFLTLSSLSGYTQTLDLILKTAIYKHRSTSQTKADIVNQITHLTHATFTTTHLITNKRTGTIDSDLGELKSEGLLIHYDIGYMAGTHISIRKKNEFYFYDEQNFNGYKTSIGLIKTDDKSELIITILGDYINFSSSFPANFWGYIKNENDINVMLDIVSSYKPIK